MDKNLKVALILSATDKASAVMEKAFHNAEKRARGLQRTSREMAEFADKGMLIGGAMTAFFAETVHLAEEAQKEAKKLDAAFANVGKRGPEIAEQAKKFAEGYQLTIGIKDDEIEAVETKLAVFHHLFTDGALQAKVFQRATKTAFDMQALGFGDAAGNAQKLGKLLNDPINNLNAMGKTLGKISPAQKAHIAALYQQNKLTEAQAYVLGLVEKKFSGAAQGAKTATQELQVNTHKILEDIGSKLLPIYQRLITKFAAIVPKIIAFVDHHQKLVKNIAYGGVALLAFSAAIRVAAFALSGLASSYKMVIVLGKLFGHDLATQKGIAKAASAAYSSMKFRLFQLQYEMKFTVVPAIKQASQAIIRFGAALLASPITWYIAAAVALAAVVYLVIRNWSKITDFFKRVWASVTNIFSRVGQFFSTIWDGVKHVFTSAWEWISKLTKKFFEAGKNIVIAIGKGIWSVITAPVRAIMWLVKKIRNFLPFSPAKEGPLRDIHKVKLVETIATAINAKPLIKAWNATHAQFRHAIAQPSALVAPLSGGGGVQIHFNPVINLHGGATTADGHRITVHLRKEFERMMKDYSHQQGRINHG